MTDDRSAVGIELETARELPVLTVEGVLEMADFKEQDHKCRIHPPVGQPNVCTFTPEQEQEIGQRMEMAKRTQLPGTPT